MKKPPSDFVPIKKFNVWNYSVRVFYGKSPTVAMICGSCNGYFTRRFSSKQFKPEGVYVRCPFCSKTNLVPVKRS